MMGQFRVMTSPQLTSRGALLAKVIYSVTVERG